MPADNDNVRDAIDRIAHLEGGRLLASMISTIRDIELAEDSVQDALESALVHWQRNGLPAQPFAWLLKAARRKAIDRLRRDRTFKQKQSEYTSLIELDRQTDTNVDAPAIADERLALVFTCCHPALDESSRVALTLQTVGGLKTREIARAFLVAETTMAQRLVRAKRKIKLAGIPFDIPEPALWPERMDAVLSVLYLIFNEGYAAFSGDTHVRVDLCEEAIRLTRVLTTLVANEAELEGLLALMLLNHSRQSARLNKGKLVPLGEQNRTLWDAEAIAEGQALIEQALHRKAVGPYQLQAAISALHSEAVSADRTNWTEIALLYEELYRISGNPVVKLNQIAANAHCTGVPAAIKQLENLASSLDAYQPYHALRADLLRRQGQNNNARAAYEKAISLTNNSTDKIFLQQRLDCLL